MSRPAIPYSMGAPPMLTPAELQKFEAPLIALANLSGGDLRKLFQAFFSFLHRRTDFYCILPKDESGDDGDGGVTGGSNGAGGGGGKNMGFREGQAEQILIASFRQFPLRRVGAPPKKATSAMVSTSSSSDAVVASSSSSKVKVPDKKTAGLASAEGGSGPTGATDTEKKSEVAITAENSKPKSKDGTADNGGNAANKNESKEGGGSTATTNTSTIRYTDDGKQIPVGNGGSNSRYVWTQTLEEVTVHLPLAEGTRAKDLDVKIGATSLSIKQKNSSADASANSTMIPLEGTLFAKIRPDECSWTLETNSSNPSSSHSNIAGSSNNMTTLQLVLDKIQKTWWSTVLSGDPIIDTTMVDSTRHIDTYDEKTQAQIRRIMFDQRQEQLGLPKSDVLIGEEQSTKVPPLPAGVEYIDGETLDKASISKKN